MGNRVVSWRFICLAAFCVGSIGRVPASLEAQEADTELLVLTPAQAGELAVQQALGIQLAQEAIEQAQAQVEQARAGKRLQGQITVVEGRMGPVPSFEFGEEQVSMGDDLIRRASLGLTQPLYTGGRVESQVEAATAGVGAVLNEAEATKRAIRKQAQEVAYTVLRAQGLAEVARWWVKSVQEHRRLSQVMYEAGTVAQFEVIQAQTELSRAEGDLIAAETGVQQALAALRRVLNLPQTQPVAVATPVEPLSRPAGALPGLIGESWVNRPEIPALQARIAQAEAGVRLARATNNLNLALSGEFAHQEISSPFAVEDTWQVLLSLTKPIFDGGLKRGVVQEAQSRLRSAHLGLESQQQQIALEVTQQYWALDQAAKQLQVATQGVVEARERARIAEVRYAAGVTPGIEVVDAQTALATSQAAQINANYDLHLALIRIYYALGRSLPGEEEE